MRPGPVRLDRMDELNNPVVWTIAGCEIGFWVLVLGGLTLRYVLRARRAGMVALALVPVLDLVLIVAVALDLFRGGEVDSRTGWRASTWAAPSCSGTG
ncbi:hypothetical protein MTP03_20730 [Tsukamurella sp. PLM1]|nr:hypothetical protein MTP03_20730 [Tsukamurella sp. PLM1]